MLDPSDPKIWLALERSAGALDLGSRICTGDADGFDEARHEAVRRSALRSIS